MAGTCSRCRCGRERVRRCRSGWRHSRRLGAAGHGALRIQQVILAWPQAQTNQRTRVGDFFGLPAVVALITPHGFFAGLVPCAGRLSAQVVLADEGSLNGPSSLRVDLFLASHPCRPSFSRMFFRGGGVSRARFRRGSRCRGAWRRGLRRARRLRSRRLRLRCAAARSLPRARHGKENTHPQQRAHRAGSCLPNSRQALNCQRESAVPQNCEDAISCKYKNAQRTLALLSSPIEGCGANSRWAHLGYGSVPA